MKIKSKLTTSYILLIFFSIGLLGLWIGNTAKHKIKNIIIEKNEQVSDLVYNILSVRNDLLNDKVFSDLYFAEKVISDMGPLSIVENKFNYNDIEIPSLYAGDTQLTSDSPILKEISNSTRTIASFLIFQNDKLIRVATNLNSEDIIGTYIDKDSDIFQKISKGEAYYGRNLIDNHYYITGYKPLYINGQIIGAIGLGYDEISSYVQEVLNSVSIAENGYVYITTKNGEVIYHPNSNMKNFYNEAFIKEIIENKKGTIKYKFNGVKKIASYTYFEPMGWYIVATANYYDLLSYSTNFLRGIFCVGLMILILGSLIAIFLANTMIKPLNKLKNYMEIASKGDLSVHSDIRNKDEIGLLSNSFNEMVKENKRLLEESREYDILKNEFIANMSHELKTPLNIIFSTSQLFSFYLKNNDLEERDKLIKYNDIIRQNCYRLLRLVNNLIDINRIDSGFMEINLKNENIVEVIENITLSTVDYIEGNGREIIFDTDVEEKFMAIDTDKMERIMLNLLSNAMKFTNPSDKIYVDILDEESDLIIKVKDTGIGIPSDKLKSIFERFKQIDPLLNRNHEGSGIGLSIVKSLVEMHDGIISVDSIYGKGTLFTIKLPVRHVNEDTTLHNDKFSSGENIEKIEIEFSDIYN
ncbi:Cache 3/Cache 2 fusion domain-containing protein [Clostridium amazonitimonense]|uniref:Cache 3/Cache 2 fusion domain-containing protein n=3 Tax=Clostridium amazonitimonense TaxID=1499689 RepID=UPI000509F7C8|nr:Cache 3/Cache 2 fusion domain-containing protein [Clostridium amazonitimonense]